MYRPLAALNLVHNVIRRDLVEIGDISRRTAEAGTLQERWRWFRTMLRQHEAGEHAVLFGVADGLEAGVSGIYEDEHTRMNALMDQVDAALDAGDAAVTADRIGVVTIAMGAHLDHEEQHLIPLCEQRLTLRQQNSVAGRMAEHIALDIVEPATEWMFRHFTPDEQVAMMEVWRGGMPPEAFRGTVALVREVLPDDQWNALLEKLPMLENYPPLHIQTMQMITMLWVSRSMSVVAELGVPDLLKAGPRTAEQLAATIGGIHAPSLYRVLRGLSVVGVFVHKDDDSFALTPVSKYLRSDTPKSIRPLARWAGHSIIWNMWGGLPDSVKTGEASVNLIYGKGFFDTVAGDPVGAARFNEAMTGFTAQHGVAVLGVYDFAGLGTICDVGGGHGALLSTILTAIPEARGILVDQPSVVAGAKPVLDRFGVAGRVEVVGGNFFEQVPRGADAYMLKMIIHDWNDADSIRILSVIRAAMKPTSRLLIVEGVVPAPGQVSYTGGVFTKLLDLEMMLSCGGKERTHAEFAEILAAAGLRLHAIHPTASVICVIDARPV